jgi:Ser/Thr protein kinase RdoA (MazF antagonist)
MESPDEERRSLVLRLRHLFHDPDLARDILSRWDCDHRPDLLERFRISANAIYPFVWQGQLRYLRFAPQGEKQAESILAELEFLHYLQKNDYPCLKPVPSKRGDELETVETQQGTYYATVFDAVPGKSLNPETMSDEMLVGWGKALGRLHHLSSSYQPVRHRRLDHLGQLLQRRRVHFGQSIQLP